SRLFPYTTLFRSSLVPASSVSTKDEPHDTAATWGHANASWTSLALRTPPAAIRGSVTSFEMASTSSGNGLLSGSAVGFHTPRCPPASGPCTHKASTPTAAAARASCSLVTVVQASIPAACRVLTSAAVKVPNIDHTTRGRGDMERAN